MMTFTRNRTSALRQYEIAADVSQGCGDKRFWMLLKCTHLILLTLWSHFTLWMSDRTLQYPFDRWRVKPQCLRILPRLDQSRN